jgi:Zn-dependent protease
VFDELGGPPQVRVAGIPVRVEWPFFLFAGVLGLDFHGLYILGWILIVFVSVLVHEFGHAVLYRVFGQHPTVHITPVSGLTHGERPLPRAKTIIVSLAGSVFAFGFLATPAIVLRQQGLNDVGGWAFVHPAWFWTVYYVAQVNIWWSIFNILPIVPLDGGHVSEALIGPFRARVLAVAVSAGAAVYVDAKGQRLVALFLVVLAVWNGMEAYRMRQGGESGFLPGGFSSPRPAPEPPPKRRRPKDGGGKGSGKRGKARRGLSAVPDLPPEADAPRPERAPTRTVAQLVASAWEALRAGDGDTAALLLDSAGERTPGVPRYLAASVAASSGDRPKALTLFEQAFLAGPPPNLVAAGVVADHDLAGELAKRLLAHDRDGVDAAATLATHLHYAGRFAAAALVGERVYADGRASQPQTAFEIACAWAQADDPRRGLEWLERAVDAGFTAPKLIDHEADLAPVRALPGYAALRERITS